MWKSKVVVVVNGEESLKPWSKGRNEDIFFHWGEEIKKYKTIAMLIGTEEKICKKMASTQETKRPKKI